MIDEQSQKLRFQAKAIKDQKKRVREQEAYIKQRIEHQSRSKASLSPVPYHSPNNKKTGHSVQQDDSGSE